MRVHAYKTLMMLIFIYFIFLFLRSLQRSSFLFYTIEFYVTRDIIYIYYSSCTSSRSAGVSVRWGRRTDTPADFTFYIPKFALPLVQNPPTRARHYSHRDPKTRLYSYNTLIQQYCIYCTVNIILLLIVYLFNIK